MRNKRVVWIFLFLLIAYFFLYKIYIPKVNAFGCFDDCFNFVGGYFLGKGKELYSQIYFNHMPLMAYFSWIIQVVSKPENIYALVLRHRQFLLVFGFLLNFLIITRFGFVGVAGMVLYEFSKFYVFGDRFLAEAFVVYPLMYLTGLSLHALRKRRIFPADTLLAALFAWFVIFAREPFVPLALGLYAVIVFFSKDKRARIVSITVFTFLTLSLFLLFPPGDFFYNVVTINLGRGFISTNIATSFLYPAYVFVAGQWTTVRIVEIMLGVIIGLSLVVWVRRKKSFVVPAAIFIILGLANLRATTPGLQYYEAFRMTDWYGLYIFLTMYALYEAAVLVNRRFLFYTAAGFFALYVIANPSSFIYEKIDPQTEFITNYGHYLQIGEVIKAVSTQEETLFTNGADELLYWVTNRNSAYRYSFYYQITKGDKYYEAMMNMFATSPPDFYYDFCTPMAPYHPSIPAEYLPLYRQFYSEDKPTCLYIKQTIARRLTVQQLAKAKEFLYYLPE